MTQNITIFGNNHYGRRHLRDALSILRRTRASYPFDDRLAPLPARADQRSDGRAGDRVGNAGEPGSMSPLDETAFDACERFLNGHGAA